MAVTVNRDNVATDDPLAADLAVSMDSQVAQLDRDTTQFTSMLMKLPVSTAGSFKEEWLEDQFLPRNTALSATAAAGDTELATTTNEGYYGKIGDVGKFVQTGEAFRITGVGASAWTVVRAIGSVSAATAATGTALGGIILVAGSNEQGAGLPTAIVTQKTSNFNYMQTVRNAMRFTSAAEWQTWYSGNPLPYQRRQTGVTHKRELEHIGFFGARSYTAGVDAPRCTAGGLDEYLSTNITTVGGALDKGALQDFLRTGLEYGERNRKVLFASPIVAQVCSEFLQDNWVRATPDDTIFGVKVDAVISAVFGAKIPVIVKNDWGRYGTGTTKQIGSRGYLVDMTNVELVKAPATSKGPRYMSWYPNRENNDVDGTAGEFLSEITYKVKTEKAHAELRGVTG